MLFQWFLIVLSVRPGKYEESLLHLLPSFLCMRNSIHSSSFNHDDFFTEGLRWLNHLSRHCLPMRSGKKEEMYDHFSAPYFSTSSINFLSSCSDHGPLFDEAVRWDVLVVRLEVNRFLFFEIFGV